MIPGSFPSTVPSTLSPCKRNHAPTRGIDPSQHTFILLLHMCSFQTTYGSIACFRPLYKYTVEYVSAFVCLNKIPHVGWLKRLKDFLTVLEAWIPRPKFQLIQGLWRALCRLCIWLPFHCVLMWTFLGVCARRKKGEGRRETRASQCLEVSI